MEIRAGTNLGRYQLLAEIGRGAMGTVYQALDPDIDRLVAIKVFSVFDATSSDGPAFRERFAQEARAAGRLLHPNIVAIYDRGEEPESQTPYIVMEYVAGHPLSNLLSAKPARMDERIALHIGQQIAEALAYAHERGVVHRDIKPGNVLINEDGDAKIADFGIARLDSSDHLYNGEVLGTPAYMSPEQLTGGEVDGRTDIFSLGVILYTMLSGYRPFQGNGPRTIGFKVVNQEPIPITNYYLDLSPEIEYVVQRAMAKNPDERYSTGTALAQDLADILDGRFPRSQEATPAGDNGGLITVSRESQPFIAMVTEPAARASQAPTYENFAAIATDVIVEPASPVLASVPAPMPVRTVATKTKWASTSVVEMAVIGLVCVTAVAGMYLHELQTNRLHALDAQIGMPPLLVERVAVPSLAKKDSEPLEEVIKTQRASAAPKPAQPDLDYTVVHRPQPAAPVPVPVAAVMPARLPLRPIVVPSAPPSTLEFSLLHHFVEANVSLWLDDKLLYSGVAHGEAHRKLFVLRGAVQGRESHEVHFPSGDHVIRVRVISGDGHFDESGSIHSNFPASQRSVLLIRCNKGGIELRLSAGQ